MPSAKCCCCAKFISPLEAARCSTCKAFFHRECSSLPATGSITPTWRCTRCKNKTSKGKVDVALSQMGVQESMDTSASSPSFFTDTQNVTPDISIVLSNFKVELQTELRQIFKEELRAELLSMREEFNKFRTDVAQLQVDKDQLKGSVDWCREQIINMDVRMGALEQKILLPKPSETVEEVAQLRREINERDQQLLSNDIEISNLPEVNGESLIHTVRLIATKLGVNLEERDIVSVDRVGGRQLNATSASGAVETRPRSVVVRLARRDLRDELMRSARVRRGANTTDLDMPGPPKRFYLNERLTKLNRQLFRRAREAGQRFSWQFVWTKHGRILARHKPGDKTCLIRTDADILSVFGPDANKNTEP